MVTGAAEWTGENVRTSEAEEPGGNTRSGSRSESSGKAAQVKGRRRELEGRPNYLDPSYHFWKLLRSFHLYPRNGKLFTCPSLASLTQMHTAASRGQASFLSYAPSLPTRKHARAHTHTTPNIKKIAQQQCPHVTSFQ